MLEEGKLLAIGISFANQALAFGVLDEELGVVAVEGIIAVVKPIDSSLRDQWKAGSRTISSEGSHTDLKKPAADLECERCP